MPVVNPVKGYKWLKPLGIGALLVLAALWLWPVVGPLVQSGVPSLPSITAFEEKAGRKYKITIQDNKVVLDRVILISAYDAATLSLDGKVKITRVKDGEAGFALPCTDKSRLVAFSEPVKTFSPKGWRFPFSKSVLGGCVIDLHFTYPLSITSFAIESQFAPFGEKGWWNKTGYHAEGTLYLTVVTESDRRVARRKAQEAWEEQKKKAAETVKAAEERIKRAGRAIFGDTPAKVWNELIPKNKWSDNLPPMRLPKEDKK